MSQLSHLIELLLVPVHTRPVIALFSRSFLKEIICYTNCMGSLDLLKDRLNTEAVRKCMLTEMDYTWRIPSIHYVVDKNARLYILYRKKSVASIELRFLSIPFPNCIFNSIVCPNPFHPHPTKNVLLHLQIHKDGILILEHKLPLNILFVN